MNIIQQFEKKQLERLSVNKIIPEFRAGDSVRVLVKVVEGERERKQPYEGVVIGRNNNGVRSTFRVRKISSGEGVERVFQVYSPNISIEVIRRGDVRRAKLYYLRDRRGKSARIAEKMYKPTAAAKLAKANANLSDAAANQPAAPIASIS